MRPITFVCQKIIPRSAVEICAEIADLARWPEFTGYAFLPGIASAVYERRTDDMKGSQVRVRNKDGSEHIEDFLEWHPGEKVMLKLHGFTPPLSRLATHFIEEWGFAAQSDGTLVKRSFQMFPQRPITRPFLWLISLFFRQAVARHMAEMAREAKKVTVES